MKDPVIGIVIQARLGSSRLPGKVLKPFWGEESILELIIKDFRKWGYPIIVATTTAPKDQAIVQLANDIGVHSVQGSDMNAVSRFLLAVEQHKLDFLVRVCADNPFLSQILFKQMMEKARKLNFDFDYLSFSYDSKPAVLTHFGFFVELVNCRALEKIAQETDDLYYLEHITNYLYYHPKRFKIEYIDLPSDYFIDPEIRLTVDTIDDFELAARINRDIRNNSEVVDIDSVQSYLMENPQYLEQMHRRVRENPKK